MTRIELLERLAKIPDFDPTARPLIERLIEDIRADGVLDVQAPPDIAILMDLPRPARDRINDTYILPGSATHGSR